MRRMTKMEALKLHPQLKKLFLKITKDELVLVQEFINDNEKLNDSEFIFKANRWYLDSSNKPKNLTNMWSILIQSI